MTTIENEQQQPGTPSAENGGQAALSQSEFQALSFEDVAQAAPEPEGPPRQGAQAEEESLPPVGQQAPQQAPSPRPTFRPWPRRSDRFYGYGGRGRGAW